MPSSEGIKLGPVLVSLALAAGGAWIGFSLAGTGGALTGLLFATLASVITSTMVRSRQLRSGFEARPVPSELSELPPQQALAVLSAMASGSSKDPASKRDFGSPVLRELESLAQRSSDEREQVMQALRDLREAHPHHPAISIELARYHREAGDHPASIEALSEGLTLALQGGSNTLARGCFSDLSSDEREGLKLLPPTWERLASVLRVAGEEEDAQWCQARARLSP